MRRRILRRRYGRSIFSRYKHGEKTWKPFHVEVFLKGHGGPNKKIFDSIRYAPDLNQATRSAHQMADQEWPGRWFAVAVVPA